MLKVFGLLLLAYICQTKPFNCVSHAECKTSVNEFYICKAGECTREDFQYRPIEIAGDVLIFLISALANAGGVGGGPMIVTVQVVLYKFTPLDSIPASKVTILVGALVSVAGIMCRRHHIDHAALLVNYPLATLMVPAVMGGTLIGVILSSVLPSLVAGVLMLIFILVAIFNLKDKLLKEMAKEALTPETQQQDQILIRTDPEVSVQIKRPAVAPPQRIRIASTVVKSTDPLKEPTILDLFCRQVPNILILLLSLVIVATCAILRGGHGAPSFLGIPLCSAKSWSILGVTLLVLFMLIFASTSSSDDPLTYHKTLAPYIKRKLNVLRDQLPVNVKIVLVSFISGILAGTLGIGGGLVMNPLLMKIGFDPQTSSALSNMTVFFGASATTCQFAAAGAIGAKAAYHLGTLSLFGSLAGNLLLGKLVSVYKRPSLIIWALLFVLILSLVFFPIDIYHSIQRNSWSKLLQWGSAC